MNKPIILDCTLRDGGYHNLWDFNPVLIQEYLDAVHSAGVDFVEFGFRSTKSDGFKGGCAYSTDTYIEQFNVPVGLKLGVMVNAKELLNSSGNVDTTILSRLFSDASESRVSLVRIAVHLTDFKNCLPATTWLNNMGYLVAFNLMQVTDKTTEDLSSIAKAASKYPIDVLYFADSFGNMTSENTKAIVKAFRVAWSGEMGIHTHDSMSKALNNSSIAYESGVRWIDGSITGMGRGPGNARTELLLLEFSNHSGNNRNMTGLVGLINKYFLPMQKEYGWGTNTFYYLAGKYGIHPTFVQEMLNDKRYKEEDVLAVIEHLSAKKGKKSFNKIALESARNFYSDKASGNWNPKEMFEGKDILLLGSGPGTKNYSKVIETFIQVTKPIVVALNTQDSIKCDLIDVRIACHPVRLLVDCEKYKNLPQPLITPVSSLPLDIKDSLKGVILLDYGIAINPNCFEIHNHFGVLPKPLVIVYALSAASSGNARRIFLAGFDGYAPGDPRNIEMDEILTQFLDIKNIPELLAITPTRYNVSSTSIYALLEEK